MFVKYGDVGERSGGGRVAGAGAAICKAVDRLGIPEIAIALTLRASRDGDKSEAVAVFDLSACVLAPVCS